MHPRATPFHLIVSLLACCLFAGQAVAQDRDEIRLRIVEADQTNLSDAQAEQLWRVHWKRYADRYVDLQGELVACPFYDPKYPSSSNVTMHEVMQKSIRRVTVRIFANLVKDKELKMPRAEAEALAKALPEFAVGEYGYIHSARVVDVVGPEEMIVDQVWLLDAEQLESQQEAERGSSSRSYRSSSRSSNSEYKYREELAKRQNDRVFEGEHRVIGFSTLRENVHTRWSGPDRSQGIQVAVVAVDEELGDSGSRRSTRFRRSSRRSKQENFILIPADLFKPRVVTEEQFLSVLEEVGISKAQFVATVLKYKVAYRDLTEPYLISTIETLREERRQAMLEQKEQEERDSRRRRRSDD